MKAKTKKLPPSKDKGGNILALDAAVRERMADLDNLWLTRIKEDVVEAIEETQK